MKTAAELRKVFEKNSKQHFSKRMARIEVTLEKAAEHGLNHIKVPAPEFCLQVKEVLEAHGFRITQSGDIVTIYF